MSWWTQAGDIAWLFFFPFIVAACLAWILPQRLPQHHHWVGGLAFGLVGGIFVLAKTSPNFNLAWVSTWESIFGFGIRVQRDPTDLAALFSLMAAFDSATRK
jgi:hypothetical protein